MLAELEQLVVHEPQALEEGSTLRRLWTADQAAETRSPELTTLVPAQATTSASRGNPLSVPWFAQLDSATDQGRRMCFSSSCAMLLAFLRPGVLSGPNGDDQYLARVRQCGDTTDPVAQIKALASYGNTAQFSKQASFSTIEVGVIGWPALAQNWMLSSGRRHRTLSQPEAKQPARPSPLDPEDQRSAGFGLSTRSCN